jgi:hypothetical protein
MSLFFSHGTSKKGAKAYKEYLARNAAKRRGATKALQQQRRAALVKPFAQAALRKQAAEHQKVVEQLTCRSNLIVF